MVNWGNLSKGMIPEKKGIISLQKMIIHVCKNYSFYFFIL